MALDKDERLRLRTQAQRIAASMNIGKSGLTAGVVDEVRRQLDEHRLLKVRLLASAREERDRGELAEELAQRSGAELVEVRGNTAVLWAGRRRRRPAGEGGPEAGAKAPARPAARGGAREGARGGTRPPARSTARTRARSGAGGASRGGGRRPGRGGR